MQKKFTTLPPLFIHSADFDHPILHGLDEAKAVIDWSELKPLSSLRERLIKTGTRLVRHARYAVFQVAEAALPREVFAGGLDLINGLRGPPAAAMSP